MNTMRKILAAALCLLLLASLAACAAGTSAAAASASQKAAASRQASGLSERSKTSAETSETAAGGWEYNQGELSPEKNEDVRAAFEKATEGLTGYVYKPVAYLGSQVVAGTNYCILCKATPVTQDPASTYVLLYIYEDLDGNAEITSIDDLSQNAPEASDGSWEMNQGEPSLDRSADAKAAFEKALEGLVGCSYEAVAYLGSQVVSGTNYCILCRTTPVYPDAESTFSLVYVYADLSGNAELTGVTELDLSGCAD